VSTVRFATPNDANDVGRLLHDFNTEFDEPTPPRTELAARITQLLDGGDTVVLLAGDGPDGLAVLRFRLSIWTPNLECYLAELYVAPSQRRKGLGTALLGAAIEVARDRGADYMDLGTSEADVDARRLYEHLGSTNREGRPDGPVMLYYERDL
jgi:ribosomal protein S18 acetylase RimI-like enzyme